MKKIAGLSKNMKMNRRILWGLMGMLVLLFGFSGFEVLTSQQRADQYSSDHYLSVSLASKSMADYSAGGSANLIARVDLGIIGDLIRDSQPDPAHLSGRLNAVMETLRSPVAGSNRLPEVKTPTPAAVPQNTPLSPTPASEPTAVPTAYTEPTQVSDPTVVPTAYTEPTLRATLAVPPKPVSTHVPKIAKPTKQKPDHPGNSDKSNDNSNKPEKPQKPKK